MEGNEHSRNSTDGLVKSRRVTVPVVVRPERIEKKL